MCKVIEFEKPDIIYPTEENAHYTIIINPTEKISVEVNQSMRFDGWTIYITCQRYDQLDDLRKQGLELLKQQKPLC